MLVRTRVANGSVVMMMGIVVKIGGDGGGRGV